MPMAMTPDEFNEARRQLGLTVTEMADMLGVSHQHVRRFSIAPDKDSHRPVNSTTERLINAYLDGYRPADWPR